MKYAEAVSQPATYLLDLGSSDRDLQLAAVSLCYFVGRADGRALVLLRRTLFSLWPDAFRYGTFQLAKALHHPDFFATTYTWVEEPARNQLRASFDWTPSEVVRLVGLIEEEVGIQRGSFGQNIFHLLVDAPDGPSRVERGLAHAIEVDDDFAITHLLNIAVYLAGDEGAHQLQVLVDRHPSIKSNEHVAELSSTSPPGGGSTSSDCQEANRLLMPLGKARLPLQTELPALDAPSLATAHVDAPCRSGVR